MAAIFKFMPRLGFLSKSWSYLQNNVIVKFMLISCLVIWDGILANIASVFGRAYTASLCVGAGGGTLVRVGGI